MSANTTGQERSVSRRVFLGTGSAIALSGCLSNDSDDSSDESGGNGGVTKTTAQQDGLSDELNFYTWGGSYSEAKQKQADLFQEEYGVKVNVLEFTNDWDAIAKQRSGGGEIDVIQPGALGILSGVKEDLIHPLRLDNFENLDMILDVYHPDNVSFDPGDEIHHVPTDTGATAPVYNTEKVEKPGSWGDFWKDDVKGKISWPDLSLAGYGAVALSAIELGYDISKLDQDYETKIQDVWDHIEEHDQNVHSFYSSPAENGQMLVNESVLLTAYFYARTVAYQKEDAPIEYVLPGDEPVPRWTVGLCVAKGAKHRYTAEKFLDFAITEEPQRAFLEEFPYLPTSDMQEVPEQVKQNPLLGNEDQMQLMNMPLMMEKKQEWNQKFTEILQNSE